jgi:hypothetical protein
MNKIEIEKKLVHKNRQKSNNVSGQQKLDKSRTTSGRQNWTKVEKN